jgi:hypothetical protein
MRFGCSRQGAVLTEKRSFRHFGFFREKILLVFEVEIADQITSSLTL